MNTFRLLPPTSLLALALLVVSPAAGQEVVQALPGTTDADALADDMRRLAANPRDVEALVDAARLSVRLEDPRAAAAFLQRAEDIDPRNPRVRAGQAIVLLQSERPGQALRYFAEAEARGLSASSFAADRGMAYDLTGQQERAQRDYARALRDRPGDAETTRRYALSLGISGQRQRAIALLDPLVRRSDRAAWRAQAFVLAMTGDVGGATRIAATMMPGGAAGLSAFFARLPTLSAVDRAFAVHFGQVRASPERLADARLAPPLSPLPREAVVLASVQPVLPPVQRGRRGRDRTLVATPAPVVIAAAPAMPLPNRAPALAASPRGEPIAPSSPLTVRALPPAVPVPAPAVVQARGALPLVAVASPRPPSFGGAARALAAEVVGTRAPTIPPRQVAAAPATSPLPTPGVASSVVPSAESVQLASTSAAQPPASIPTSATAPLPATTPATPVVAASLPSAGLPATPVLMQPGQIAAATPATTAASVAPGFSLAPSPQVGASPPPALSTGGERVAAVAPSRPAAIAGGSEDSILARIVANLSIPAAELGVGGPPRAMPAPAVEPVPAGPKPVLAAKPNTSAPDQLAADKLTSDRAAAAKVVADRRAAERKAAADKKALADRKAAAEKKALADKEAADKTIERANPERIWVQVAGGANEGDLRKAYAAVKAKAPAVIGSRGGWTTPLRATNRVLTGPFKTDAEARAFVNDLNKAGVSAFTFTSDPGQPVKRLGEKGSATT